MVPGSLAVVDERHGGRDGPGSDVPSAVTGDRSQSFGAVADAYQCFRPSPPVAAVDWLLPARLGRIVDLGSGTGRLTRLLVDRADQVVAIDPDQRMRAVLVREVPAAHAVGGRGESIPLPDASVDAVLAATSWHWMDAPAALREIERVLVPGGTLGVLSTGADREGRAVRTASAVHERGRRVAAGGGRPTGELSRRMMAEVLRPVAGLEIPPGAPFEAPEFCEFPWRVALDTEELVGLMGTFSWVLTLPEEERATLLEETRSFLAEVRGITGTQKVEVPFRARVWRTHRLSS